jgi:hypothetical protein
MPTDREVTLQACDHMQKPVSIGYPRGFNQGGRTIVCSTCGAHPCGDRTWIMGEVAARVARNAGYLVDDWWFDNDE